MRQPSAFSSRWSSGTWIIILANVACFLVLEIHRVSASHLDLNSYAANSPLALSWRGIKQWQLWQLVTFQFMHGGILHLLLNCLTIYFAGRPMEEALGRTGFFKLYFFSGTLGGLLQIGLAALAPRLVPDAAVVGASAGAFGLVAAFATMHPHRMLTFLLFLIVPVNMKAWVLLLISGAFAVYGLLFSRDGIAHAAHLGGMLGGMGFVYAVAQGWSFSVPWPSAKPSSPRRQLVAATTSAKASWSKASAVEEPTSEEFISREVDPILEKISAHGIHSLTDRERRILEAARQKMSKR